MTGTTIRPSRFTEYFIARNAPATCGFCEWLLRPGMLFGSSVKWWADGGPRASAHEGLDLCHYRNTTGAVAQMDGSVKVPVMYDGVLVKTETDYLGKSVYIGHGIRDSGAFFVTVYGHVVPDEDLPSGTSVREGQVIASVSGGFPRRGMMLPHLHITVAILSPKSSPAMLSWAAMHDSGLCTLVDPLPLLGGQFFVEE